ncbi:MAG: TylF/MycF/NovP-related O-methyltransferase [Bacteroidia bacterium]
MLLLISTFQISNILLILILFFLFFKIAESKWSYKISKPYSWEAAIKNKIISKELKRIEQRYHDKVRFYNFWFQVERLKKQRVEGAFAELGVYKGETAKMLHLMDKSRKLHLFDTFSGFNDSDLTKENNNEEKYNVSNFADTNIDAVKNFIGETEQLFYHVGYFPDTTKDLVEDKFALVHLDADLYQPTITALNYFYPKLSSGGVIIIHDYNHTWPGVVKAVDEFILIAKENIIPIPDWQGSVMIIKNNKF